eukprot:Skav232524  [mRNA]  locus=scaffold1096:1071274:1072032:- [translate_table: standard]
MCPCCRKRELEVQALALTIHNGFVPNPEIDEDTDGLGCYISKKGVEDVLFNSYHPSVPDRRKRLSQKDWDGIKREWELRRETVQSTFISSFNDLKHQVRDVAMWYYGVPVCVAFNSNRRGSPWGFNIEFFTFAINIRRTSVNHIELEDIREAFWEKYGSRFEDNDWRKREMYFSFFEDDDTSDFSPSGLGRAMDRSEPDFIEESDDNVGQRLVGGEMLYLTLMYHPFYYEDYPSEAPSDYFDEDEEEDEDDN